MRLIVNSLILIVCTSSVFNESPVYDDLSSATALFSIPFLILFLNYDTIRMCHIYFSAPQAELVGYLSLINPQQDHTKTIKESFKSYALL